MKNWKNWVFGIISFYVIIITVINCENGENPCNHNWEWVITTQATLEMDGLETKICSLCGKSDGTRTIPKLGIKIQNMDVYNIDGSLFTGNGVVKMINYLNFGGTETIIHEIGIIENGKLNITLSNEDNNIDQYLIFQLYSPFVNESSRHGSGDNAYDLVKTQINDTVNINSPNAKMSWIEIFLDDGISTRGLSKNISYWTTIDSVSSEYYENIIMLMYCDQNTTIFGELNAKTEWVYFNDDNRTIPRYEKTTYNLTLNRGWNTINYIRNFRNQSSTIQDAFINTSYSNELPSNINWVIY